MKTKLRFGTPNLLVFLMLVLLGASFPAYAQCPTINTPAPSLCDAAGFKISDLNVYANEIPGNGIRWYSSETGGMAFNENELVSEGVYYAGDDSGTCGTRESLVIDFQVDASGQNLDAVYCSNENATIQVYIDDALSTAIPTGGTVEVYTDFLLTSQAIGSDIIPTGGTNYFIIFVNGSGCRSQIEIGTTAIFEAPDDPSPPLSQMFCDTSSPTVGDLDPGTTDTFSWYDSIDVMGDPIQPELTVSTPLVDGNTYYIQVNDIFCFSNPIAVSVIIDEPLDPGTSTNLEYCSDSIPTTDFNLFDELSTSVMTSTGGSWTGPLTTTNGHLGTVNISTLMTPGDYIFTYMVPVNGICPQASSTVTITIFQNFNSGIPSADNPASFCVSGLPNAFDLFTLLDNEDVGGQWTQSGSTVTSTIDFTGFSSGTYDYVYTQNILPNPCPENSTTVQVIILEEPNAGSAINASICENEIIANSPFDLFSALDGTQDNNSGDWTDSNGATISSPIDITSFTVANSPFEFTYTLSNGTCEDSETINITIEPSPESGNALMPVEICFEDLSSNSPFDLFTLLDGTQDTNGIWYSGSDASGTVVTNPVDISGLSDGTFDYTYSVPSIGSCTDVDVTVQIIVFPQPNTGVPSSATFCENDVIANSPLDLFGQLTGNDLGGVWSDDNATGALSASNVDLTLLPIGSYNFTYSITSSDGCTNSSTVVITIEDAPESGTVNMPAVFCADDITTGQTLDLFDLLDDEDQTGIWSDDNTSGALTGNTVTLDGLAAGTYSFTYDVNAIGTCDDSLVTVTLTINDIVAPTAPITQAFCDAATVADLAITTGVSIQWYDEANGGSPLDDSTPLVDGETYYATQTDATTGCESSIRFEVTISIPDTPISGNPVTPGILECNDNNAIDLNLGLDGSQDTGGVWQDNDATGQLTGNIFDATGLTPGTYEFTYFIAATPPCLDANTVITVTIEQALNPGTDNTLNICSDSGTTDLFPLLGGADLGGVWSPELVSTTGIFDPLVDETGIYTYTLTNSCGTFSSDINVTVSQPADAGTDNTITVCVIDGPIDLFTQLGGTPNTNGVWSPELTSTTGVFDPSVDSAGMYTYTVLGSAPCTTDASAEITISVLDTPEPTLLNAMPEFCLVDNPTVLDLDAVLTATGTIVWYADNTLTTPLSATDTIVDGEDYYATQTSLAGCESSVSVMVVTTVNDSPTPTLIDINQTLCINDNPMISDLSLNIVENGSVDYDVIWYDVLTDGNVISSSTLLTNGTSYFAVLRDAVTGCESSVRLEVTPDLTACGNLIIPDGFSPNGDGINDTYDVDNLEVLYPEFEMEIYNRYGNKVYQGNASSPRFDGTSNQSSLGDKVLPVGVYFYIFKFNDGQNKPVQGRLYLSR